MNSLIRGGFLSLALLLFAAPASADSYIAFYGSPPGGATSTRFEGDWDTLTGDLILDDVDIITLRYLDGTTTSSGSDPLLGATFDLFAEFNNGALVGSSSNYVEIADSSGTYYKATIHRGEITETGFVFDFVSQVATSTAGSGMPIVDDSPGTSSSDWILENAFALSQSGAAIEFFGMTDGTSVVNGVETTQLTDVFGKLTPTPEPGTIVFCGAAVLGFAWFRRRRRA